MYEHRSKPLISRSEFVKRVIAHGGIVLFIIVLSLIVGMVGYHSLASLPWMDSFLNAAMIMGGMGPVDHLGSDSAKLFAGVYALYSGLVLLISVGIVFAPVLHRIIHRFHLENK